MANASSASYSNDSARLVSPGTTGPGASGVLPSIDVLLARRCGRDAGTWSGLGWHGCPRRHRSGLGGRLGGARRGRRLARRAAQLAPFLFRKAVVLLPLVRQALLLFRRQLLHLLVVLARGLPFLGGEL